MNTKNKTISPKTHPKELFHPKQAAFFFWKIKFAHFYEV